MLARHHQQMHAGQRMQVAEGDEVVVAGDQVDRYLAAGDAAEEAVAHVIRPFTPSLNSSSAQALTRRPGAAAPSR